RTCSRQLVPPRCWPGPPMARSTTVGRGLLPRTTTGGVRGAGPGGPAAGRSGVATGDGPSGACSAGTSAAGTSADGGSAAGTSADGGSADGTSADGTSAAGGSADVGAAAGGGARPAGGGGRAGT